MKTLVQIHREGKFFVAVDLITNVADQGLTEEEAVSNLKKGLEEHYQVLLELAPKGGKLSFLDIEVEPFGQASGSLG
jgi:predicted RNase H-like HicB family nuclease